MASAPLWRRADFGLAAVIGLALLVSVLSLVLASNHLETAVAEVVQMCLRTWDGAVAHSADLGRFALLAAGGLGLAFASVEASRSLWATRRWVGLLALARSRPPRRVRRLARTCGLDEQHIVVVDIAHPLVFTHGLVRPRVWLSTGLLAALPREELEAVLWHEAHHVRGRDPLRLLLARSLSRALFFIPIAQDVCAAYVAHQELAADRHTLRAMGAALPLARALRRMLTLQPVAIPARALVGKLEVTEVRLRALLDPQSAALPLPMSRLGASLFWLILLLALLAAPSAGHFPTLADCAHEMARGLWPLGVG